MLAHKIKIGKCIRMISILLMVFENSLCGETCTRSEVSFSLYIHRICTNIKVEKYLR